MLYIFGKRLARIGRYIDTEHICYPCKSYDREILIYRPYFHLCFIPVFPIGRNEYTMRCRNCGDKTMLDSVLKQYKNKTRTPFYLFSAWILACLIAMLWFYWNSVTTKHKYEYVDHPIAGDVYTISEDKGNTTSYYFMRVVEVKMDSVKLLHNSLDYGNYVNRLEHDDFFVKDDTLTLERAGLRKMLAKGEIYEIDRGYGKGANFDQIK